MIYFYRCIYLILKILLLILKPVLPAKLQTYINLRNQEIKKINNFKNTYWFHAASGEIEYCKSLIRLLKAHEPEAQIVVTYSSPSAEKLFHNIKDSVDQFIPLCWDQPTAINRLIDYIQPKALIFSRTDLWPELITQAHKRQIKMGVISFNPSFGLFSNLVLNSFLPQLDFISCVDENVKQELQALTDCKNISSDGDTRYDQVFYRLSQEPKLKIKTESKVFVCGSTWPEDEAVLFECFPELIKAEKLKIILSPHEVDNAHIIRLEGELSSLGLTCQKLSSENDLQNINFNKDVLIIDKIGYLADAYRFADIAFVGGSFKAKIHSVMEPLCCGIPVITGPFYKNNPEAVKYHNHYVSSAINPAEITSKLAILLSISKEEILSEMKKNQNASERILKLIKSNLD